MAGGLNSEFAKDPLAFLRKHKLSVVDGNMQTGSRTVGFYADRERVLLKQFLGTPGKHQHPFSAYFLRALPNDENRGLNFAATTERFFFTSTLSGCQVLIHGDSLNSLTVAHNNCLTSGSYDGYQRNVPDATHSVRVHNGGLYNIDADDVGNVVGIRGDTGWAFYFQKISRVQGNNTGNKKSITVTRLL